MNPNSVDVIGGGPAGLYFAFLLKRRAPAARVRVLERNPAGATFGFGVVFSDKALEFIAREDPATHALLAPRVERWRDMTLRHGGETVKIDGIGFAAIARLELLGLLARRARLVGVDVRYGAPVDDVAALDAELVVGADGLNSAVRRADPDAFEATTSYFENRFAWFGAACPFDTLTQTFIEVDGGCLNAHHYRYSKSNSTFIVECSPAAFERLGFADLDEDTSAQRCAAMFAEVLGDAPLLTNHSVWRRFPRLWCGRWVAANRVLIGDAAHTAHFSIGSGTRIALEDAIALDASLANAATLGDGLAAFEAERLPVARKMVDAANTSAEWYDGFSEKMRLAPLDFAYDYITRSGRVSSERLRAMSPRFMAAYESRVA